MTLAVTVERYIAVCRPHQYRYISKVIISSLKNKFKYSKTIFISSTSYFIYGLMSHFTPFHLTDNRLWKYNLAMCKDKYYILVGYALSKLANFARTSMLHFLIVFQEISYLLAPAAV